MGPRHESEAPRWLLIAVLAVVAVVGAACGGADAEEPVASTAGSEAEAPDEPAVEEPVPDPALPLLELTAAGTAFDKDRLVAPAGEPFQILLHNRDDIAHNVSIYPLQDDLPLFSQELFEGEFGLGPITMLYEVPALEAGKYVFYCDAHLAEQMKGAFIVR